jgi:hypothetical protein
MRVALVTLLLAAAVPAYAQTPVPVEKRDTVYVTQAPQAYAAKTAAEGMLEGRMAAKNQGTGGYVAGGFLGGLTLGLIGTGIVYLVAASSATEVPAGQQVVMINTPPDYRAAYIDAYGHEIRSKRKTSALVGGLAGTATFLVIYLSAY